MKITFKNNKLINRITNTGLVLIAVTTLTGCTPARINVTEYMAVPTVTIEANRAKAAEDNLSSTLSVVAGQISLKVSKADLISEINVSPEALKFTTPGKIIISGGNFTLDASGNCSMTGTVNATAGGTIGGFAIGTNGALESSTGQTSIGLNGITTDVVECSQLWGMNGGAINMYQPLIISGTDVGGTINALLTAVASLSSRVSALEARPITPVTPTT